MPDPLPKIKYYVKCGDLEKWVMAVDSVNAAFLAFCGADEGIELDPYFFYVCDSFVPDIVSHVYDSGEVLVSEKGLSAAGVELVKTDDILNMLDCE